MEVSVIRSSQAKAVGWDQVHRDLCLWSNLNRRILSLNSKQSCFGQSNGWHERSPVRLIVKANAVSEPVVLDKPSGTKLKPDNKVKLYVGMPIDTVSDCNSIRNARAISAGLRALKLLGVEGVEIPVWWGVAEREAMGKYNWLGYLSLVEMVEKAGLKVQISLNFHASCEDQINLPEWVLKLGENNGSIFFTDQSGERYRECLSLGVDELPVLDGKSPIQVYGDFCENFKSSFSHFLGSTITGISISLGPGGELRYPSHHHIPKNNNLLGVGEFQCYDENMLNSLKVHAENFKNPMWGLSGPHDAPNYNHTPNSNTFVKEHGGSWETQYGDFFLSWYSTQLVSHGDRLLSLAMSAFRGTNVEISGKIPFIHSWYKSRSHPNELTSGIYNTVNRDGYEAITEIFARNSCELIVPGMDLCDESQPNEALSSPESLLSQITKACERDRVKISGQNSALACNGFENIKKNLSDKRKGVKLFTYQRMGAYFFSPQHFPKFTEFVRSLNQPELELDDLPGDEKIRSGSLHKEGKNVQMQTA